MSAGKRKVQIVVSKEKGGMSGGWGSCGEGDGGVVM